MATLEPDGPTPLADHVGMIVTIAIRRQSDGTWIWAVRGAEPEGEWPNNWPDGEAMRWALARLHSRFWEVVAPAMQAGIREAREHAEQHGTEICREVWIELPLYG